MRESHQCRTLCHSIWNTSFQYHTTRKNSLTASALLVTGALRGRESVFLQAICGWVMTRVHYGLICHYQTLAFWLWRGRRERSSDECQGWKVKTRMNDGGAGEGIWRDENAQRGNGRRLGSLENYKLKGLGTTTQKQTVGYDYVCFTTVLSQYMSCGINPNVIFCPQ